ncbi:unnamed protein product, partial [Tetraodon nigroviridis]
PRLKKSAHEVILEFIRSRPPLNPARCRPGNSSRRRSLLPRCTNASWKKSKLRGSWGPCRRARCAGQSWVRTHTHTHTHTHSQFLKPRFRFCICALQHFLLIPFLYTAKSGRWTWIKKLPSNKNDQVTLLSHLLLWMIRNLIFKSCIFETSVMCSPHTRMSRPGQAAHLLYERRVG